MGPKNYLNLLVQRASIEGFVYFDYAKEFPEAINRLAALVLDVVCTLSVHSLTFQGKLKFREHVVNGLESAPNALLMLFSGQNDGMLSYVMWTEELTEGKLCVKVGKTAKL